MITLTPPEMARVTGKAWFIQGTLSPDGQPQRIPVPAGKLQVGRRPDVSICLGHSSVSKLHAELIASEFALFVRDLGSTNGTFLNGMRVIQDTPLGEGDIVRFADFEFVVGRTIVEDQPIRTMVSSNSEWQSTLTQFHRLMTDRAVIPYFQPIIRFSDVQTIGYEVLARSKLT